MRHGLTTYAVTDLLRVVNEICGEEVLSDRYDSFKEVFRGSLRLKYFFCCLYCGRLLGEHSKFQEKSIKSAVCDNCGKATNVSNLSGNNFFIYIPIEDQLRNLFERTPNMLEMLQYRFRRENVSDTIQDVFDGSSYKYHCQDGKVLSNPNNFSVTVNSDGSPIFKSTHNTMHPVQCRINEVPPDVRFESWNCLVAGIWFGAHDPEMSALLHPFIEDAKRLSESGFTWTSYEGETVTSKMLVLNCVLDSVAKPKVQGTMQFNAHFGCNYCIHPGVMIDEHPQPRYSMPLDDFDVNINDDYESEYNVTWCDPKTQEVQTASVKDRSDESMRKVMFDIQKKKVKGPVQGVVACSPLYPILYFNLVFGFTLDYMHAVLIGVCKLVTGLWLESTDKMPYFIGNRMQELNDRMKHIKPPSSISRRPRSMKDYKMWKANEWRAFLLYYSLPCLVGILPPVYLKHHCLLVSAVYILLQDKISSPELWQAAGYLKAYVCEFQHLYGEVHMNFNVHLLLHLCRCVAMFGPLWTFSAFCFEAGNGRLVKLVRGTRYVAKQIAEKYVDFVCVPETISMYSVSQPILDLCDKMFSFSRGKFSLNIGSVTLLGGMIRYKPSAKEMKVFAEANINPQPFSFPKMIKNNVMYFANAHRKPNVGVDDSAVKLEDGTFAYVERIVNVAINLDESEVYLLCRNLNLMSGAIVSHSIGARARHIKICQVVMFGDLHVVGANHVQSKVMLVMDKRSTSSFKESYIIEILNHVEKD